MIDMSTTFICKKVEYSFVIFIEYFYKLYITMTGEHFNQENFTKILVLSFAFLYCTIIVFNYLDRVVSTHHSQKRKKSVV